MVVSCLTACLHVQFLMNKPIPDKRDYSDSSFAMKETLQREQVRSSFDPAALWQCQDF